MKKIVQVEKAFCDVCGEEASKDYYWESENGSEGVTYEYNQSKHIDLCDRHLNNFKANVHSIPDRLKPDRYDPPLTEDEFKELVDMVSEFKDVIRWL